LSQTLENTPTSQDAQMVQSSDGASASPAPLLSAPIIITNQSLILVRPFFNTKSAISISSATLNHNYSITAAGGRANLIFYHLYK